MDYNTMGETLIATLDPTSKVWSLNTSKNPMDAEVF
jgi:hypothetical protein